MKVIEVESTAQYQEVWRLQRPAVMSSQTTVGGYTIEGHVPASEIQRLLKVKPKASGLAVPGMPIGSPGMEVGTRRDAHSVLPFDSQGKTTVYVTIPPDSLAGVSCWRTVPRCECLHRLLVLAFLPDSMPIGNYLSA